MIKNNDMYRDLKSEAVVGRFVKVYRDDSSLFAATTRRETDMPENAYAGFSLCHYTGDSPEHFKACRNELADYLGIDSRKIIIPRQTHGTKVAVIDRLQFDSEELQGVDALVTNLSDVAIGINTADCVPILIADTGNNLIAAVHAGWRGVVGGIIETTISEMARLGGEPSKMEAWIAPCIHRECFEVGEEVACSFPESCVDRNYAGNPHVDLPKAVRLQLEQAGLNRINEDPDCTRCHPDRYFSARAHTVNSGRNFTFILRKES